MKKHVLDLSNPRVARDFATTLINNTPVGYLILDKEYRVHFANEYFTKMRNVAHGELIGNHCYNLFGQGEVCPYCVVEKAMNTGKSAFVSRKDVLADGSVRYFDDYAIPLLNKDGGFDFILDVIVNRTTEMLIIESNEQVFVRIIELLASMMDKKDAYTSTHSRDVTAISLKLAKNIGLDEGALFDVRVASLFHDVGKLYVPDSIINKQDQLSEEEWRQMTRHAAESYNLLDNLSRFADIKLMAGHHHERWDGTGYPGRLKGSDIPLGARIIAIADAYDAMTSARPYRAALSHKETLREIGGNAGGQFDPVLADIFIQMCEYDYSDRESLLADETEKLARGDRRTRVNIERRIDQSAKDTVRIVDDLGIIKLISDDNFVREIIEHTPAYYLIVDKDFNILYASDNFIRDIDVPRERLDGMRCFEIDSANFNCLKTVGGRINCPVARALRTGAIHRGYIADRFKGVSGNYEMFAVPIKLEDAGGEPFDCAMEILIDRTREINERTAMNNDVKGLLGKMYRLISGMSSETTSGSEAILRECETFGEYLEEMRKLLTQFSAGNVTIPIPETDPGRKQAFGGA